MRAVLECADGMSRLVADDQLCKSAKQRILTAAGREQTTQAPGTLDTIWRPIMRSKNLRYAAAAAVIIVVAVLGLNLNARTIVFDLVIGNNEDSPVMHEEVSGSRIKRTISNMPALVMILDLDDNKMLALDTHGKTAGYVDLGQVGEKTQNYIESVRKIIVELQNGPDIEKLPEREVDGKRAIGFKGGNAREKITIWADPRTALPIRIELEIGQMCIIFKDFEFDPQIEEISMDVPPGYTLDQTQSDLSDPSEQDFVESLRIWAEIVLDGTFPDAVSTEDYMKDVAILGQKIPQLDLPDTEKGQLGGKFGRGMLFFQNFEMRGEWHYGGKGTRLGDADKAIFWYLPEGSQAYRVIYGDLHVADVAPENLPE